MNTLKNRYTVSLLIVLGLILIISCQEETIVNSNKKNLNSFSMNVNGESWSPSVIDSCNKTFMCNMSELGLRPLYNIEAYRDPAADASIESENIFVIQITNVTESGIYPIDGARRDFENYAQFRINNIDSRKVYINKENSNLFNVEITELIPIKGRSVVGIKGLFNGILYNRDNPLDSIQVENGEFTFEKTNWYNFNQCDQ